MKYRPDIDGMRALAVLGVILFHADLGVPGGYVGVDVFFVISGFLITGIVLRQLREGSFSYLVFWKRRVRRLVPALFLVTVVTASVAYLLLLPMHLMDLGGALIAQPLMLVNVYFWRVVQNGYFGEPPEIRPLLHTWSLGVEEQFYLLYPLLLVALWRIPRIRSRLFKVLSTIGLASFVLCVFLTPAKEVASFFNIPTRAWELIGGGILVLLPAPRKRYRESLSALGVLLVLYAFFFFDETTVFPGSAAAIPVLGTALLIWAQTEGETATKKFFSWRPFVLIGLASYSLYLWHWPIIAFAGYIGITKPLSVRLLLVGLSFTLGVLSYKYVETPMRSPTALTTRKSVALLLIAYICICSSLGTMYLYHGGFSENWSPEHFRAPGFRQDFRSFRCQVDPTESDPVLWELGDNTKADVDFILWGDSHAMSIAPALDTLGREHDQKGLMLTRTETPPLLTWSYTTPPVAPPTSQEAWSALCVSTIKKHKPKIIYLHGHWSGYYGSSFDSDLRKTLEKLEKLGIEICIIEGVPHVQGTLERKPFLHDPLTSRWPFLKKALQTGLEPERTFRTRNQPLYNVLKDFPRVQRIDVSKQILNWSKLNPDGLPLYQDAHHITDFGALKLKELFRPDFLIPKS